MPALASGSNCRKPLGQDVQNAAETSLPKVVPKITPVTDTLKSQSNPGCRE